MEHKEPAKEPKEPGAPAEGEAAAPSVPAVAGLAEAAGGQVGFPPDNATQARGIAAAALCPLLPLQAKPFGLEERGRWPAGPAASDNIDALKSS